MPGSTAAPWATVPTAARLHLGVRPAPASHSPQGKMEQWPCSAGDMTLHVSTMSGGCPKHRVPLRQQPGTYMGLPQDARQAFTYHPRHPKPRMTFRRAAA